MPLPSVEPAAVLIPVPVRPAKRLSAQVAAAPEPESFTVTVEPPHVRTSYEEGTGHWPEVCRFFCRRSALSQKPVIRGARDQLNTDGELPVRLDGEEGGGIALGRGDLVGAQIE